MINQGENFSSLLMTSEVIWGFQKWNMVDQIMASGGPNVVSS
jgi:hypothetical protein